MADRVLLLAGSVGPERVAAHPDPDAADWYLPLHLRDEGAARERLAGQIAAGADVIIAPTWVTHRRALLPLGETRRARAWTAAAVRTARQAVEIGLERREEALADAPESDLGHSRPKPLVAASLPALDDESESATGHLLPREAATERDYRDQAGVLADAEPDIILVEGQHTEPDARTAAAEAVQSGLPVWTAMTVDALGATDLESWVDWALSLGMERLLVPGPLAERAFLAEQALPWGALAPSESPLTEWLDAGAGTIGWLDGANTAVIERLRTAIDEYERAGIEATRAADQRWSRHVAAAAALAPGGAAVWVGPAPATPLPAGFEWLVVTADEARRLPDDHYRLAVIAAEVDLEPARILQRGGVVAVADTDIVARAPQLQLLAADDSAQPVFSIARRDR